MSCQGDCCVAFRVPFSLVELARGEVSGKSIEEAAQLADMLLPLTVQQANARQLELVRGTLTPFSLQDSGHLYKCRHWDEETRLCGIYEDRPPMCRTFPYGDHCRYGCDEYGIKPGDEVII